LYVKRGGVVVEGKSSPTRKEKARSVPGIQGVGMFGVLEELGVSLSAQPINDVGKVGLSYPTGLAFEYNEVFRLTAMGVNDH
jgi:hypothetical protein